MPIYIPEGYHQRQIFLDGSNTRAITVLVCEKCGSPVMIFTTHNNWHKEQETFKDATQKTLIKHNWEKD